jgi:LysM repeat protein
MRRLDHTAPFDHEFEAGPAADLTEEFWGRSPGWQDRTSSTRRVEQRADRHDGDTTGALRVIRDGVTAFRPRRVETTRDPSGQMLRTRAHGSPAAPMTVSARIAPDHVSIGDLAAGTFETVGGSTHEARERDVPLSPSGPVGARVTLGGVDPLLARLGVLVLVGALLVPLAMALRPSRDDPGTVRIESPTDVKSDLASPAGAPAKPATAATVTNTSIIGAASTQAVASAAAVESMTGSAAADAAPAQAPVGASNGAATGADSSSQVASAAVEQLAPTVNSGIDRAASVDVAAERVVPECPQTYFAAAGDSWYRIADAAGVTPAALLSENRSTLDAVIFPGDEICLPAGATVPAQPTTTTAAPVTDPPTTDAPVTTNAPPAPASVEEVKQMIRDTWPADQHETALYIAQRESKFDPLADNNFCCFGIFQIYWEVHKGWLADYGIHSSNDLLDASKNIAAAYALYQRSGGWGPWGM